MKRTWMTTVFAAATMTVAAHAQDLRANVPFDFNAVGKRMPAGTYVLTPDKGTMPMNGYVVRNLADKTSVFAVSNRTISNQPGTEAKLIFRCASGTCALAEIHEPGKVSRAFPISTSRNERVVAVRLTTATNANGF
ncbi:MAG: hypothetical protein HY820_24525 [Acidobacteria bacterium]|nr:hypothetical protein [Acidobacteriota bacterium]